MEVLTACVHHWICDTPTGPISKSRCRLCGEEKEFNNRLGGEQAERLPYEGGAAYLPEQRQVTRLEVTKEPEAEPKPKDTRCLHSWHSADPDEQGIAHIHCTLCPQEYWMDLEGRLYDGQKHMLSRRRQGIQPGEMVGRREKGANVGKGGQAHSKHAEYMRRWPEMLKMIQETSFEAAVGKFGIPSGTLYGLLRKAGLNRQGLPRNSSRRPMGDWPTIKPAEKPVSTEKPKHGGSTFAKSVALRPVRKKAEELFRQGKQPVEVARVLAQEFGAIPLSTLRGWRNRMEPGTPAQRIAEVAGNIKEAPPTKEDQILGMLGALQISISSLAAAVKSLQKEPPRCKLTWENGDPVFVCETREDAHRMQDALLRHTQIRQPK